MLASLRVLIMTHVALSGFILTGLVGPNRSSIEAEYGLSHSQFGYGFAALQMLTAAAVVVNAHRLARRNTFRVLTAALAVTATGFALVCGLAGMWSLTLGWLMIALGTSLVTVTNKISVELWLAHPRRGLTLLHGANAGGKVAGATLAAACLAVVGWRASFLVAGALTLVLLMAYLLLDRASLRFYREHRQAGPRQSQTSKPKRTTYWHCILPFGLIAGGEAAFVTLMPTYFEKVKGLSAESAGLLLTIHLIGLMAGRLMAAQLGKRVGNNTIINICLASTVFVFPAMFVDHWLVRGASLLLAGGMSSATWPTYYAQIHPRLASCPDTLAYGARLGTVVGISACVLISSIVADTNITAAVIFGPAVFWLFAAIYYGTGLGRPTLDGQAID